MIIFDHTALLTLARGHRVLSGLVHRDVPRSQRSFVPALCLVAASLERPGITAHVGALPGMDFLELDHPAAEAVERSAAGGLDWPFGHAAYAAAVEPAANVILSRVPEVYDNTGLTVTDVTKLS